MHMRKVLNIFSAAGPEDFRLTLGWLRDPGETITPAALPKSDQSGNLVADCYRAYLDAPVGGTKHFSFASLGRTSLLINPSRLFRSVPFLST